VAPVEVTPSTYADGHRQLVARFATADAGDGALTATFAIASGHVVSANGAHTLAIAATDLAGNSAAPDPVGEEPPRAGPPAAPHHSSGTSTVGP
jgi:hypothetical protein